MIPEKTIASAIELLKSVGVPDRDLAVYSSLTVKEPVQNNLFRRAIVKAGYEDPGIAHELWILCARDPLFFLNTFAYLLETRKKQDWNTVNRYGNSNVIPFITRGYQDKLIMDVVPHLGLKDIVIPKSRETGISWMIGGALAAWDWIFHDQTHIGFVSKDLLSANNPDDPDALFSKFHFLLQHLPCWLLDEKDYERNITKNTFRNLKNGSSLTAYAAKADIGRGGRKAWMLMDEFHFFEQGDDYAALDSTVHVTPCRIFVSTANRDRGMAGAFYDVVSDTTKNGIVLTIDWKDDPDKRRGLYHGELIPGTDNYRLVIDDMDFWRQYANFDAEKTFRHPLHPGKNYDFILDERYRSLYYDHVWNRPGSTPQSVSAELDRNFGGATSQIFNPQLLQRAIAAIKQPLAVGDILRHPEKPGEWMFQKLSMNGLTDLWVSLDNDGKPPVSEYVFGADVSAGTGGEWSSYSALEGLDRKTGEQVFQWRGNKLDPMQFAELTVWVCKLFYNAYLVPEVNGPLGQLFLNKVIELQFPYVFRTLKQNVALREPTDRLGYRNNDRGIELLKKLESAIRTGRVRPNSLVALNECGRYFMKNGRLVHSAAESTDDGAGKGLAHGDAAIALGCAAFGVDDMPIKPDVKEVKETPFQSFKWRREQWERRQAAKDKKTYWD